MSSKPIFISHAKVNKELADKLVDFLENGIGIRDSDIFCSSLEGLGIPSGTNFVDFIRKQISDPKVVILLLTYEYFNSSFCLCELGATWIMTHKMVPLLMPPLEYSNVKVVLAGVQVINISEKAGLNEMQDELITALGIKGKPFARWEAKRDKFLEELSGYLRSYTPNRSITKEDFENVEKKYQEAVEEIKSMEEEITQQSLLIQKLEQAKDADSVKQILYESSDDKDKFESLIENAKKALNPLPSIVCEALYYYFRNERLPYAGFADDDRRDEIKNAIEQDFLQDCEDGLDIVDEDPKISKAMEVLNNLNHFLSKVEDARLEENIDIFSKYYLKKYGHRPKFTSRRFWKEHLF